MDMHTAGLQPAHHGNGSVAKVLGAAYAATHVIKVKGEADRSIDVHATSHGFVQSWDIANGTACTARRSWQGREIETLLDWAQAAKAPSAGQSGFVSPAGERDRHCASQLGLFEAQTCKQDWLTAAQVDAARVTTKRLSY